jgi:response regulator RpfG family c-di-GMP phosphodiesterase
VLEVPQMFESCRDRASHVAHRNLELWGTILVAENEDVVRKLILMVVRKRGHTVIEAGDGEQALEIWTQYAGKIDLLLTDTAIPGMSGPMLSQRLKAAQPEIKVLYYVRLHRRCCSPPRNIGIRCGLSSKSLLGPMFWTVRCARY